MYGDKKKQKQHFNEYRIMNETGDSVTCTRKECFAPADPDDNSTYPQRWYYSPDGHLAIRLPRNELGEKYFRWNDTELKAAYRERKDNDRCVRLATAACTVTCDTCSLSDTCKLSHRSDNGLKCTRKCDLCDKHETGKRSLDYEYAGDEDDFEASDIPDASVDVADEVWHSLFLDALAAILPERELQVCAALLETNKFTEVAAILNLHPNGLLYIRKKLAGNKVLENFLREF